MKNRNSKNISSSLELLLDTMCNTFGGVIFIAITLVIISVLVPCKNANTKSLEKETASLVRQLKALRIEEKKIVSEKQFKNLLNKISGTKERKMFKEYMELKENNKNLRYEKEKLIKKANKFISFFTRLEEENKKNEMRVTNIDKIIIQKNNELKKQKTKLKALQKRFAVLSRKRVRKNAFPKLKKINKFPVWIIVTRNELYFINDSSVRATPVGGKGTLYTPIPGRGYPVSDTKTFETRLIAKLSKFNKNFYFVSILVTPDSVKSFLILQDILYSHNYNIFLAPVTDCSECILYPVSSNSTFRAQ